MKVETTISIKRVIIPLVIILGGVSTLAKPLSKKYSNLEMKITPELMEILRDPARTREKIVPQGALVKIVGWDHETRSFEFLPIGRVIPGSTNMATAKELGAAMGIDPRKLRTNPQFYVDGRAVQIGKPLAILDQETLISRRNRFRQKGR